jgi:hypothetical protein
MLARPSTQPPRVSRNRFARSLAPRLVVSVRGARGGGVERLGTAVPSTGPLYHLCSFEALSVADMVGPSRRAPVHAEAMRSAAVTGSGYETSDGRVARVRAVGWNLSPSLPCRCLHPEPGVVIWLRAMAGTRWLSPRLSLTGIGRESDFLEPLALSELARCRVP